MANLDDVQIFNERAKLRLEKKAPPSEPSADGKQNAGRSISPVTFRCSTPLKIATRHMRLVLK